MEKSFVQIIPEGNKNTCYVGFLIPEEDVKVVCDEACDDMWLMVKHELPMLEDIQVFQPHHKKNMYLVTRVTLAYTMIDLEDIIVLSDAIHDVEQTIIDLIKSFSGLNNNAKRIKSIFNDFPSSPAKLTNKKKKDSNEKSYPVCAQLIKVGQNRQGTITYMANHTDLSVEAAEKKYIRLFNHTSQYEFLHIFQSMSEAQKFAKAMEEMGNEVLLQYE